MNESAEQASGPENGSTSSRSWKKIGLYGAGLLIGITLLAYLLLPYVAAPVIRSYVVSAVSSRTGGTCRLDRVSVSWDGSFDVDGIRVTDANGEPLLTADGVQGQVDLVAVLRGNYQVDATLLRPHLTVRRMREGRFNVGAVRTAETAQTAVRTAGVSGESASFPVHGRFDITDGRLTAVGPDGQKTELSRMQVRTELNRSGSPSRLSASLDTPGSPGGSVEFSGTFRSSNPWKGDLDVKMDQVSLAPLSPAVALVSKARDLRGTLNGSFSVNGGSSIRSESRIRVENFHAGGFGEPVRLPEGTLTHEASLNSSGTGSVTARVSSGRGLQVSLDGQMDRILDDSGGFNAKWTLQSRLDELSEKAPPLLQLKTGWRLDGALSASGRIRVEQHKEPGNQQSYRGTVSLTSKGTSMTSTAPSGKTVALGDPSLDAEFDLEVRTGAASSRKGTDEPERGVRFATVDVRKFRTDLPGIQAEASGRGQNLITSPRLSELSASVTLDLDVLQEKMAPFNVLSGMDLSGSMSLDVTGSGTDPFRSSGTVKTSGLTVKRPDRAPLGPFDLQIDQSSSVHFADRELMIETTRIEGPSFALDVPSARAVRPMEPGGVIEVAGKFQGDLSPITSKLVPLLKPAYRTAFNRSDLDHLSGSVRIKEVARGTFRRTRDGWSVEGAGTIEGSNLAGILEDGSVVSLSEHVSAGVQQVRFGAGVLELDGFLLESTGLKLAVKEARVHTGGPVPHVDAMSARVHANLDEVQTILKRIGRTPSYTANGSVNGTVEVYGVEDTVGKMRASGEINTRNLTIHGFEDGSAGPFTGEIALDSSVLDLRDDATSTWTGGRVESEMFDGTFSGSVTGIRTPAAGPGKIEVQGTVRTPEALSNALGPFLAGYRFSGEPMEVRIRVRRTSDGVLQENHRLSTDKLRLVSLDGLLKRPVTLSEVQSSGSVEAGPSSITVRGVSLSARSGRVQTSGEVHWREGDREPRVLLKTDLRTDIKPWSGALPESYGLAGLTGTADGDVEMSGSLKSLSAHGTLNLAQLTHTPPGASSPRFEDRSFTLRTNLELSAQEQPYRVEVEEATTDGDFVRLNTTQMTVRVTPDGLKWSDATVEGSYHPDHVGAIAGPWLPAGMTLSGDAWKTLRFELKPGRSPVAHLPYALQGTGRVDVGDVRWKGMAVKGTADVTLKDEKGRITYDLSTPDGSVGERPCWIFARRIGCRSRTGGTGSRRRPGTSGFAKARPALSGSSTRCSGPSAEPRKGAWICRLI